MNQTAGLDLVFIDFPALYSDYSSLSIVFIPNLLAFLFLSCMPWLFTLVYEEFGSDSALETLEERE